MAGISVSSRSQVTLPLSTIALTLAASGGPSARTRMPVAFSNGSNITFFMAVVLVPPHDAMTISPLSARAGLARMKGLAIATPEATSRTDRREKLRFVIIADYLLFRAVRWGRQLIAPRPVLPMLRERDRPGRADKSRSCSLA